LAEIGGIEVGQILVALVEEMISAVEEMIMVIIQVVPVEQLVATMELERGLHHLGIFNLVTIVKRFN